MWSEWDVGGTQGPVIGVESDRVGAITELSAAVGVGSKARLRLNHGLVLGKATMGDVLQRWEPVYVAQTEGEGTRTYIYSYYSGCEGGCLQSFSYTVSYGPILNPSGHRQPDPGGFNARLNRQQVTAWANCDNSALVVGPGRALCSAA